MSDFELNEATGDILVEAGVLFLTEGDEATRQRLALHLRLVKGEWFLDINAGTDYYGSIFGKKSFVEINAELVRAILSTDGIVRLASPLEFNLSDRVLAVTFEALLSSGETVPLNFNLPLGG